MAMQYFVRSNGKIDGPLSIDEINSRIAAKSLGPDTFASAALGETTGEIAKAPEKDWLFLAEIPGVIGLPPPAQPRSAKEPNTCLIGCVCLAICFIGALIFALMYF